MGRWEHFGRSQLSAETVFGRYPLSIIALGGAFIISEVMLIAILYFYAFNGSKER
jgi:hypothetical protein